MTVLPFTFPGGFDSIDAEAVFHFRESREERAAPRQRGGSGDLHRGRGEGIEQ